LPLNSQAEKVLILTLQIEAEVRTENWEEINRLLESRDQAIASILYIHPEALAEIHQVEERTLTLLRQKLRDDKAEMRTLNAALRLTYRSLANGQSTLQLAS
jgi:hypothetical protein